MQKRFRTVCFTGHREIPPEERDLIVNKLEETIIKLIKLGYMYFGTGGALGFDTLAAQTILKLKPLYPHINLILVLPCETQADKWKYKDKQIYDEIKKKANKYVYISKDYTNDCLFRRNRHLVENSSVCICYYKNYKGGTSYTVNYAISKKLLLVNIADEIKNNSETSYLNIPLYENYVFYRDYRDNKEKMIEDKKSRAESIKNLCGNGLIDAFDSLYKIPKVAIPKNAITFERLVHQLDNFTKLSQGTIKAVIDYFRWVSYIEIYLPFLDFCTEKDFELLRDISQNTNAFFVTSTESGGICLWLLIHYFDVLY